MNSDSKSAAEELSKDERLSGLEPRMIELIMNEVRLLVCPCVVCWFVHLSANSYM